MGFTLAIPDARTALDSAIAEERGGGQPHTIPGATTLIGAGISRAPHTTIHFLNIESLMKILRTIAVMIASAASAFAAQPVAADPNLPGWEAALAAMERRANLLRDEIKALDSRIETRAEALLASLRSIGDSKDSRSKVARMKEETIEALRQHIIYYRNKRAAMKEQLRRPTLNLTGEEKKRMIAMFDERINKRAEQIITLLKSLPTHKDYERYKVHGSDWAGPVYAVNEDYLQNQRLVTITNRLRKELSEGLRQSIARLERDNRTLMAELNAAPNFSSPKDLTGEMAKNETLIAERREQISQVLSFVSTPTRKIGQREAIDFDQERLRTVNELRRDFENLFARYNTLIVQLSVTNSTRATIAAAKARAQKSAPAPAPAPASSRASR